MKNRMKNNKKKKVLTLSLVLAAMLLPATTVSAQGVFGDMLDNYYEEQEHGGMLGKGGVSGSYSEYEREDGGLTLGGMTQDDPTSPLGSGLLILAAAGAGYALLKKKEEKA